jgi:hypothetical protein
MGKPISPKPLRKAARLMLVLPWGISAKPWLKKSGFLIARNIWIGLFSTTPVMHAHPWRGKSARVLDKQGNVNGPQEPIPTGRQPCLLTEVHRSSVRVGDVIITAQKSGLSAVGIAAFLPGKYPYKFSAQTNSGQPPNVLKGRR